MKKILNKNGVYATYYRDDFNGNKLEQRSYKNGQQDGKWFIWFETGQKASEGNYKDGKRDGRFTSWNSDGQISFEGSYKDNKEVGIHKTMYQNNQLKSQINYKNISQHIGVEWHENGQKSKEFEFINGRPDGVHTCWYDNGVMKEQCHFNQELYKISRKWLATEISRTQWDEHGNQTIHLNEKQIKKEDKELLDYFSSGNEAHFNNDPYEELGLTDDERSLGRAFWSNLI